MERALSAEARWLPHEEESLRSTHSTLLESQGRFADLTEYLAAWVKKDPETPSPYARRRVGRNVVRSSSWRTAGSGRGRGSRS